ncbi:unnamed protein product [Notodromas monacha]|uniref:ABC-2 type transporter transmembrane domain-containing protein n=1 Tax=Notodromas monacha TaxID=399045 RepID=A0A7R9BCZ7_9CRUS|nr:unnamed protein product [Notodromas monacha]CAG0912254.1 unnamed protein product [Notodromas monacha]
MNISDLFPGEDVSWQLDREKDEFQPGSGSYFKQLRILSRRAFLLIIRDKILLWTRLGAHVFIGIVLGLMFQGIGNNAERAYNNAACLYFNHVVLIFAAMMATVLTIPMELPVIVREHMNCWYSVKMYFLTQTLIDVPFQVFFTIIYQCITYFLTGQPPVFESFALVSLLAIVLSIAAQSVGVAVGASIDPQTAVFIGPILTVPMLLFCGFLISIKNMPTYMQWIPYITYLKYAYEGTMAIIYQKGRGDLDCEQPYCHFKSPEVFMEELDLTEAVYWPNLAILTLFAVSMDMGHAFGIVFFGGVFTTEINSRDFRRGYAFRPRQDVEVEHRSWRMDKVATREDRTQAPPKNFQLCPAVWRALQFPGAKRPQLGPRTFTSPAAPEHAEPCDR